MSEPIKFETMKVVSENVAIIFIEAKKRYGIVDYATFFLGVLYVNLNHYVLHNELSMNDFVEQLNSFAKDSLITRYGTAYKIPDGSSDEQTLATYISLYSLLLACRVDFSFLSDQAIIKTILDNYWDIKKCVCAIFEGRLSPSNKDYKEKITPLLKVKEVKDFFTGNL